MKARCIVMRDLLRDEELLAQVLRRRLLRSVIRAVGVLGACGRGKVPDPEGLLCARALARLVPRFVTAPRSEQREGFEDPKWWTVEKLHKMEILASYDSREDAASMWRTCFDKNGPQPGLFQTRQEAGEYGRKRYDELVTHQDKPEEVCNVH
jgi:hypothetical protein